MIDFELEAVGEGISAAHLGNQRKADEILQFKKFVFCDIHLNLFADKAGTGFDAENIFSAAAGHSFFADADSRAHTDVALSHALLVEKRQTEFFGWPSFKHPFSFYFHVYTSGIGTKIC